MVSNRGYHGGGGRRGEGRAIELNPSEPSMTGILAYPYFTSYVRNQLTNPEGKYAYSTSELFKGGLKVITTLDIEAQTAAEEAAAEKEEEAGDPFEVAMAVVNPENGYIDALVGGRDYESSQVNMATGRGRRGPSGRIVVQAVHAFGGLSTRASTRKRSSMLATRLIWRAASLSTTTIRPITARAPSRALSACRRTRRLFACFSPWASIR